MFFSDRHAPDARCGIIIDIGSASVAAAIVVSEIDELKPTVVWSHTERCPITDEPDTVSLAKKVTTTLLNVSLEINNTGLKKLATHDPKLRPQTLQVAVAAPWSYTIPKHVTYSKEEEFTITDTLVTNLIRTAENETTQAHAASPLFENLGLAVISSHTSHFTANGYRVQNPVGQKTRTLALVRNVSICQKRLVDAIAEVHEAIAPKTKLTIQSFMEHMQHHVLTNTIPSKTYALIDISGDATEVGVVVDGTLTNTVSNTWGHYAVAREIAAITQEPLAATFSRLQASDLSLLGTTPAHQAECALVLDKFSEKLANCISSAAQLSELPSHYVVHSDTGLAPFARRTVVTALQHLTLNTDTSVAAVSDKLIDTVTVSETRLALSIAVFHTTTSNV
jgi:hypothetical protein